LFLLADPAPALEARTEDERGSFHFESVAVGEYTLTGVEMDGARRSVQISVRAGEQNVVLRLPEQGMLRGRVLFAGGVACPYALIHVEPGSAPRFTIQCAKDGTFRFPACLGTAWIRADGGHVHSRFERVSVEAGRETAVGDLVVVPTAELRLVTGRGAPRAHVAISDETGPYFAFDIEPSSERTLRVPVGPVILVVTCAGQTTTRSLQVERGTVTDIPVRCGP
jgi:hypothetical protein